MKTRLELERAILGPIIFCNGFALVADVLTEKNFIASGYHKIIFLECKKLFPLKPIDPITLVYQLRNTYGDSQEITNYIFSHLYQFPSTLHLVFHSYILLQEDIKKKFLDQVIEWKAQREKDYDHSAAATLLEVAETINSGADIFEVIEKASEYFMLQDMEAEYKHCKEYYQDLVSKTKKIKRMDGLNQILNNLSMYNNINPETIYHNQVFIKAIKDIFRTGVITEKQQKAVKILAEG